MKCPYDLKGCDQVDTSGMTKLKECCDCERFNYGIRPTVDYFKKRKNDKSIMRNK